MNEPQTNSTEITPQPTVSDQTPANDSWREKISFIIILLLAPICALFIILFVFQSYQVEGPSMQPTLQNSDRLIVWKLPRTISKLTGHVYIPHRGDIVIFSDPALEQLGESPKKQLIKRVIALPGERVVVKNDSVTVYNQANPNGFNPDKTLSYGKILTEPTRNDVDLIVPKNQIFVMGDNRTNSLDSRILGPVDSKYIVGKLTLRVVPLNQFERF